MDEIQIGNCMCNFIFKRMENKLLFNKCNVIGNFQNMGKRHLEGVLGTVVRGLGSRGEEEGCWE